MLLALCYFDLLSLVVVCWRPLPLSEGGTMLVVRHALDLSALCLLRLSERELGRNHQSMSYTEVNEHYCSVIYLIRVSSPSQQHGTILLQYQH